MKTAIIIGGGIAGLAAGIYAQKAGMESVIYEKHTIAGGECTGWDRQGFHIDGSIHWLMGTLEGTGLNKIWKDVGALGDVGVYQPDSFATMDCEDTHVILYREMEQLKRHLLELAPEDKAEIEALCTYIKPFYGFEPPCEKPVDLMGFVEKMKFYGSMQKVGAVIKTLGKINVAEYLQRFRNPALRAALASILPSYYSAYILPSTLATFISGNGGRPMGGSRALAQRMEEKYKSLGGKLVLATEVMEIIVDKAEATGIVLGDGTTKHAHYIIPACDVHITLKELLQDKFRDQSFETRYQDRTAYPLLACVYVALGIDADLSQYPENYVFETEPFAYQDQPQNMLSIKHYCYEPSFAPPGKSIVIAYFHADYDWWAQKRQDATAYKAEKARLATEISKRMEQRFPELSGKVKMLDVATPLTYERYCGAYQGSYMAFGMTPKSKQLMHDGRIKGIDNLYMAGQWLMPPGGLPTAVITGKWAIQRILKRVNH
ncbi:MAG: NAD(P)/FAD-dependent oxidoreductase [Firmicutes bacterium]|nr:NAD(P)/FAD-dependent oxidoreductase [Bacillota bacterium]